MFLISSLSLFKYFFQIIVSGIDFLISFCDCSLLKYRNTTDIMDCFCILCNLLNPFISSNNFGVESQEFSMCVRSCCLQTYNFISSFPIWMCFICLSWLIALPRTSTTMLKEVMRAPCLIPGVRGIVSILSQSMILAADFSYIAFLLHWGFFYLIP